MDNEYYAIIRKTGNDVVHYGIPGMHWGVRKYLDKNGKMTPKGLKRYGKNSTKKTSARRMQKDYNRLDRSYANNRAEYIDVERGTEFRMPTLYTKGMNDMSKQQRMKLLKDQSKGIKSLQNQILQSAKKKYDVQMTPKKRLGSSIRDMEYEMNGGIYAVPHAANHAKDTAKYYNGNEVKIRKRKR